MHASDLQPVKPLAGGGDAASVELVRGADGRLWVLKRHRPAHVAAERRFQQTLSDHGLPSLRIEDCPGLAPDQLLLEYVPDSPTIGGSPSLDLVRRWGEAIGRLHQIPVAEFARLDDTGQVVPGAWRDFLQARIAEAIARQRHPDSDLPAGFVDRAERHLAALHAFAPRRFVLTHGDLHLNNALVRGGDIVLFDKPAGVWRAPAVFDLALIFSEAFPGARYGADRPGDDARLAAFLEGYGEVPPDELAWLDGFVLLRSLRRYPSLFVPELRAILELALDRLAARAP